MNGGVASRADWARDVVARAAVAVEIVDVPSTTWQRPSKPPRWGVLAPTPLPSGEPMRPWPDAMADYAPALAAIGPGARMSLDRAPVGASPGVRYGAVARHADDRGSFRELWRAPGPTRGRAGSRFVQANCRRRRAGVLRGLHLHRRQLDYWVVASGRAFVALVDVRPMLDGRRGAPTVETRELAADEWVVIPEGVAHGFLALEPLELLYLVTNQYDGSDELGFAWDDPAVGGAVAGRRRTRLAGGRSSPNATRRTRRSPSWSRAFARSLADRRVQVADIGSPGRYGGADAPHRTRPAPTGPHRTPSSVPPKGLAAPGPSRD